MRDDPYRRLTDGLGPVLSAERLDLLCERITDALDDLVPSDSLSVYEVDTDAGELVARVVRHPRFADAILRETISLGVGVNGWSASRREPLLVPQAQRHPRAFHIPGTEQETPEAQLTIPLVARGRLVGHLCVRRYGERSDLFSTEEFELVCRFGDLAAVAFDNVTQRTAIEQLVRTDGLTGLANRRGLEEELERAVALAQRHGQPLALLFIDLNKFKGVNDSFGHRAGDELIRQIASALKMRLRRGDLAARVGGDEFVVVLPQTDHAGAAVVADVVREDIANVLVSFAESEASVSAAVGVAQLAADESAEGLLDRADRRMYIDKRRDR